jgi:carboxyl-terminal processing protease
VQRKGWDAPKKFNIVRAKIEVESVSKHALDGGIGYVKIKQFQARTAEDLSKAVREIEARASTPLTGLILDLRNNPGGLLDQSVEVSNLFLDDGVIVVTQEGGVRVERKEVTAVPRPGKLRVPVIVLVNGGSASASEIVSGALKNRDRALIIGDQTFGKGSVQQLYDFPDSSSLKLTIGQYLTPGDESIQSVGITPDVRVRAVYADSIDNVNLFPDTIAREEDLAAHLDDARIQQRSSVYDLDYLSEQLDESEAQRRETTSEFVTDFEIDLAMRILKSAGRQGTTRKGLIDVAAPVIDTVRAEQEQKIDTAMRAIGVEWVKGAASTSAPSLAVRVIEAAPVSAGETMQVTLEVENTGPEPLFRVHGVSTATFPFFGDREFLFGKLAPGESRRFSSKVRVPKDLVSRADLMRVRIGDATRPTIASIDVPMSIQGLPRPRFAYALFLDDARSGNGDGLLQVGEAVDLVVSIKNTGDGPSEKPMALLKNLGGSETFIDNGRAQLGALKPGDSAIARFSFKVQEPKDMLNLRLQVFDSVMGDYLVEKLRFPIKTGAATTKKIQHTVAAERPSVPVYAAADGGASIVAHVEQGAKLDAVAEVGDFVRVRIGKELFGYVASAEVGTVKGRAVVDTSGVPKGLSAIFGRDPPQITFAAAQTSSPLIVDGKTHDLRFTVEDDGPVADVYVFVGDEKIHYQRLGGTGATNREISTAIKLEPGVNIVTVVAREDDEFAQREVLTIFSRAGDPLAEKQLIKRH